MAERQGRADGAWARLRQGHRPRDARQRRLLRLRLRATQQGPLRPRAARDARCGGVVRARAGDPRLAHARRQARQALGGLPAAQAPPLRAVRLSDARDARLARRHPPLHLLDPPLLARLRPANRQSRTARRSARRLDARLPDGHAAASAHTRRTPHRGAGQRRRQRRAPARAAWPARPAPRPLRTRRPHQEPIRAQTAGAPGRARADIAAARPTPRASRGAALRLRTLLADRALAGRTAETARKPLRPSLAGRRDRRRRQAARAVRPLFQGGRTAQPPS
ncbi:hypothetical protein Gocc_1987 [Gaiella occulta]|uniref:Uncharacterized protein n=1 Tax=Gaiella occulta TaxID=1002870 RepID=A0A7M2YW94_9ACTN|nr:hypothetical protein Gocc_1987 [Gaiella occulta]